MKILYIIDIDLDTTSGVAKKVCSQSKIWVKKGHTVILLSWISLSFFDTDGNRLSNPTIDRNKKNKLSFLINLYKSSYFLKDLISNLDFDVVYMRYRPYDIFFKSAIKGKPIVAEMNTVYETETKLRSLLAYIYYTLFKKLSFATIDGFVCVSDEINEKTLNNKYKSITIANGIDVTKLDVNRFISNKRPAIVFIGSANQEWHGVDKFIYLAKQLKEYNFHIIGSNGIDTENLFYHGYLREEKAVCILNSCDVGVSSTAMHRLNMDEASPLKSRQYLALGLPIIYGYDDTDIRNKYSFVLHIPNTETNVQDNIKQIKSFIENVFNDMTIRNEAKKFAQVHLDFDKKENIRLDFIKNIMLDKNNK